MSRKTKWLEFIFLIVLSAAHFLIQPSLAAEPPSAPKNRSDTDSSAPGFQFPSPVQGAPMGAVGTFRTFIADTGEEIDPSAVHQLAIAHLGAGTLRVRILTTEPSAPKAHQVMEILRQHGLEVELVLISPQVEKEVSRLRPVPADVSPPVSQLQVPHVQPPEMRQSPPKEEPSAPKAKQSLIYVETVEAGDWTRLRRYFREKRDEVSYGITAGLSRAVTSGITAYYIFGLPWEITAALMGLQTGVAATVNVFRPIVDRLFGGFAKKPGTTSGSIQQARPTNPGNERSKHSWGKIMVEAGKRAVVLEIPLAELWKYIMGFPVNWETHRQVLENVGTAGAGFALANAARNQAERAGLISEKTSRAYAFWTYVIGTGLQTAALASQGTAQIAVTTTLAVALAGSAALVKLRPDLVERHKERMSWLPDKATQAYRSVWHTMKALCHDELSGIVPLPR
ncbi:MAG: hypothetical protein HY537_02065 [Deltaproteobacteria bacterium]|nr:hypothetical protein [Deltaproteobacteria bacterium]